MTMNGKSKIIAKLKLFFFASVIHFPIFSIWMFLRSTPSQSWRLNSSMWDEIIMISKSLYFVTMLIEFVFRICLFIDSYVSINIGVYGLFVRCSKLLFLCLNLRLLVIIVNIINYM